MPFNLDNASLKINASLLGLGENQIALRSVSGSEHLNRSFEYHLDCLSTSSSLQNDISIGQKMECSVLAKDLDAKCREKKIIGYITELNHMGVEHHVLETHHQYEIKIASWLGLLDKTSDSRVFVKKNVQEIILEILKKYSSFLTPDLVSFKFMKKSCTPPIAVQYDESDSHFISRLLEENGLFYYFDYSSTGPIMQVCDDTSSYTTEASLKMQNEKDWHVMSVGTNKIQPKTTTQSNYGQQFKDPINTSSKLNLFEKLKLNLELFTHYETSDQELAPEIKAKYLKDLIDCEQNACKGSTHNLAFMPGKYFISPKEENYAITGIYFTAYDSTYLTNHTSHHCNIDFLCVPRLNLYKSTFYRKPIIAGLHRASIMGDHNKKTDANEDNMVQIGFHWDRYVKKDTSNACFAPVLQNSAGKEQGFLMLPHVGDEVFVSFLDGDPYEPIIVGSTFTNKNKAKINKKNNPHVHMLYTAGNNSILFDDTKGQEKFEMHASKDYKLEAKNNIALQQKKLEIISQEKIELQVGNLKVVIDQSGSVKIGDSLTIQVPPGGSPMVSSATPIIFNAETVFMRQVSSPMPIIAPNIK